MNRHHADGVNRCHRQVRTTDRQFWSSGNLLSAKANHQRCEALNCFELVLPLAVLLLVLFPNPSRKNLVFGDDDKQGQVDREDAFAQDGPLPSTLAVAAQKRLRVLKVIAVHDPSESLRRRKWVAVASVDVADLAFGNHNERLFVDAVLPREEAQM